LKYFPLCLMHQGALTSFPSILSSCTLPSGSLAKGSFFHDRSSDVVKGGGSSLMPT